MPFSSIGGHGARALLRPAPRRRARRGRSRRRGAAPRGARAAARPDRADRVGELHVAVDPRGGRLGADEQVRRGLPRQALLRRLRGRRPDRAARDRPGEGLFGAEHANVQPHAGAQANMAVYFALMEPGDTVLSLRLDHGGHLTHGLKVNFSGPPLHDRSLRRLARDEPGRLRRGARAREGAPAEGDPLRRLRLPAHGGDVGVPQDRRRGRRAALVRHGPLLGPRRGRAASEPGARLRRRQLDDPQDARRPARRLRPLPRGARGRDRPRHLPGPPGRPARARDRREGDVLQDRRLGGVPRVPDAGARERRRARGRARRRRPRRPDGRHRHASRPARPAPHRVDGQGRGGAAARGEADDEPQHGPVRRAAADGRLRRPARHARRDDAGLRRGRLPRGRPDHRRGARRRRRRARARRARARRSARSGRCTRASAATRGTRRERRRRRGRPSADPAQGRAPAGRHHDDADVPPARQRADAPPHLRGDEDARRRGGSRSRRRSRRRRPAGSAARRSPSARSSARGWGCSTASFR